MIAIQLFKGFLDAFSQPEAENTARSAILKEYLDSQIPDDAEDKEAIYLTEIMQTWSYAAQSNNEALLSAAPAVLALLLRTISSMLEFSSYGVRLCRTLLQKRQLELMNRGLKANKTREFLISPVLRLLREITLFDGGLLAKQVFRARDQVFQNLPRNLNLRYTGDNVEDKKKPSVRTNAVRFVLSLLRLLPLDVKKEFLQQRDIVSALTRDLKDDPPHIVRDILGTLKASVLKDDTLPRESKTKIINAQLLSRISMLYRYDQQDDELEDNAQPIDYLGHDFLQIACTSPTIGILNKSSGYYPRGVDPDETHDVDFEIGYIDLGIDSIEWMDKFTDKVPVRNTILSEFVQSLRPWSDTKQNDLLLSVFAAAPELVAEYYYNKTTFSFDPKLTATWMGYAALIYSSIQLPLPKFFGHQDGYARLPPPTAIVLENILPNPLSQKVLRACLIHDQSLITFFAVRILCVAFTKLQSVLKVYYEASSTTNSIWKQAAARLVDDFCSRCPSMKGVIFAYRKISDDNLLQREACTKLLVLYFEVAPKVALEARFDVSEVLAKSLSSVNNSSNTEERAFRIIELENLFQFAHFSPGMKWFSKMSGMDVSPFTTMLKLCAEAPQGVPLLRLRSVLSSIVAENGILQTNTSISSMDSLILSLRSVHNRAGATSIYQFVDDCASRCATKPVNYIFALEESHDTVGHKDAENSNVGLLTLAMAEQWPFFIKSASKEHVNDASDFFCQHLARSIKIKEDKKVLNNVIKQVIATLDGYPEAQSIVEKTKDLANTIEMPAGLETVREAAPTTTSKAPGELERAKVLGSMVEDTSSDREDRGALTRWTTKEVDEVIEGGHLVALILLLSSEYLSVRKEALTSLAKFAAKLKESPFEEKEQVWLLLSELTETAKKTISDDPLPTIITSFASHAVPVLIDPLHVLYAKINKFLSLGPTWEITKIPLLYKILDEAPTIDDAYYTEMSWLLTYLLGGLRVTADMDIFRKRRVFEKLFSIYNNPYLGPNLKDKILRLLFRATAIEGGSTTMITRFSAMTWLQAQVALGGGTSLKVLMEKILETSDQRRVKKWSHDGIEKAVKDTLII